MNVYNVNQLLFSPLFIFEFLWYKPFRYMALGGVPWWCAVFKFIPPRISRFSISVLSPTAEPTIIVTKEAILRPVFNFAQILPARPIQLCFLLNFLSILSKFTTFYLSMKIGCEIRKFKRSKTPREKYWLYFKYINIWYVLFVWNSPFFVEVFRFGGHRTKNFRQSERSNWLAMNQTSLYYHYYNSTV